MLLNFRVALVKALVVRGADPVQLLNRNPGVRHGTDASRCMLMSLQVTSEIM